MPTNDPINTAPIEKFIQSVKVADNSRAKEIKIDIDTAKNLSYALGIVMARMNGDLEKFVAEYSKKSDDEVINVTLDGGTGWK